MPDDSAIMRDTLLAIRLELDARGLPLKVCASKAGVSYSTFLSWFPASGTPQIPSLACLPGLAKALPGDLLSMLVPDGFHIVPDPSGIDYDDFSAGCRAFIDAKEQAHHPESPAGRDISDCEKAVLNGTIVRLPIRGKVA
jgi:hypothetical protein